MKNRKARGMLENTVPEKTKKRLPKHFSLISDVNTGDLPNDICGPAITAKVEPTSLLVGCGLTGGISALTLHGAHSLRVLTVGQSAALCPHTPHV